MASHSKEEREKLAKQIHDWNASRLDLFHLSDPNENLDFFGVMRFYFQGDGEKVSTKCIRVASTANTTDIINTLVEKFRPDMRMLSLPSYALYEVHVTREERRLSVDEYPLVLQLNWGNDLREGRFLLKGEHQKTIPVSLDPTMVSQSNLQSDPPVEGNFKRKLSKREKKEQKKKEKEAKLKGKENQPDSVADQLYNELPETSFTRSISNPEAVMRRRRQMKLEKKLEQFKSKDGGPDTGGTLKIYGQSIKPDVPYKTLLLSMYDTAEHVVKETLIKYGLDQEDPDNFCLSQVLLPSDPNGQAKEFILDEEDCPLSIFMQHNPAYGQITFHMHRRPPDQPRRKKKKANRKEPIEELLQQFPYLLEINPDGSDARRARRFPLSVANTEIGCERNVGNQYITIYGPDIYPRHCVVSHQPDGMMTVSPAQPEAVTLVNGQRIDRPLVLRPGMMLQLGKGHFFRFCAPMPPDAARPDQGAVHEQHPAQQQQQQKDMETSFDVDGRVEAQPSKMMPPPESIRPSMKEGPRELCLPAQLEFMDEGEEAFLAAVITNVNVASVQFKLAPTYTLYLAMRHRVACVESNPNATAQNRDTWIGTLAVKMAQLCHLAIQSQGDNAAGLSFWMANASELLHFLKQDRVVSVHSAPARDMLAEAVQVAFTLLVDCMQAQLQRVMPAFLDPSMDDLHADADEIGHSVGPKGKPSIGDVLQVLSAAMSLLRRCRVNAALTIQLFSQLFHFVNMWLFNKLVMEPHLQLCTREWGHCLKRRLGRVDIWAEKQGLELAADCHLARIIQAAHLLEAPKSSADDLASISSTCFKLNSLQLRCLLENYIPMGRGEPRIPADLIDSVVAVAQNTADELTRSDNREVKLMEDPDLQLPFLLPEDGYSCDIVKGVPNGLPDFIGPLSKAGLCRFTVLQQSNGGWTVFMGSVQENLQPTGGNELTPVPSGRPEMPPQNEGSLNPLDPKVGPNEPEVATVTFNKVNGSLGLSIVAAKGERQRERGIYVKSVVPGGGAAMDGRLQAGDQLMEVDGHNLIGLTQERAAEFMTKTGQTVTLRVAKQGAIYHGLATLLSQPSPVMARAAASPSQRGMPPPTKGQQQRPLSENVDPRFQDPEYPRNAQRPINMQHSAQSSPALAGQPHEQMPPSDPYGSYRGPPPHMAALAGQQPQQQPPMDPRESNLRSKSTSNLDQAQAEYDPRDPRHPRNAQPAHPQQGFNQPPVNHHRMEMDRSASHPELRDNRYQDPRNSENPDYENFAAQQDRYGRPTPAAAQPNYMNHTELRTQGLNRPSQSMGNIQQEPPQQRQEIPRTKSDEIERVREWQQRNEVAEQRDRHFTQDVPRSQANTQQYQQNFYQNTVPRHEEANPPFEQLRADGSPAKPVAAPRGQQQLRDEDPRDPRKQIAPQPKPGRSAQDALRPGAPFQYGAQNHKFTPQSQYYKPQEQQHSPKANSSTKYQVGPDGRPMFDKPIPTPTPRVTQSPQSPELPPPPPPETPPELPPPPAELQEDLPPPPPNDYERQIKEEQDRMARRLAGIAASKPDPRHAAQQERTQPPTSTYMSAAPSSYSGSVPSSYSGSIPASYTGTIPRGQAGYQDYENLGNSASRLSSGGSHPLYSQAGGPSPFGAMENEGRYDPLSRAKPAQPQSSNKPAESRGEQRQAPPPQPQKKPPPPISAKPKPPPVASKPQLAFKEELEARNSSPSPSPWERDQKEREGKRREEEMKGMRDSEIADLESRLNYLTPEEKDRLRKLRVDQEFERRAQEALAEDGDSDTDMGDRAAGRARMLKLLQNDVERRRQQIADDRTIQQKRESLGDMEKIERAGRKISQFEQEREEQRLRQQRRNEKHAQETQEQLRKQRELREQQRLQFEEGQRLQKQEEEKQKEKQREELRRKKEMERDQMREMRTSRDEDLGSMPDASQHQFVLDRMQEREQQMRREFERIERHTVREKSPLAAPKPPERNSSYNIYPSGSMSQMPSEGEPRDPMGNRSQSNSSVLKHPAQDTLSAKKSVSFHSNLATEIHEDKHYFPSVSSEGTTPTSTELPPPPPPATQPDPKYSSYNPTYSSPAYTPAQPNYPAPSFQSSNYNPDGYSQGPPPPSSQPYSHPAPPNSQPQNAPQSNYQSTPSSYPAESNFQRGSYTEARTPPSNAYETSNSNLVTGDTPGVIGAGEVYRDPRDRIAANKPMAQNNNNLAGERLSFRDKMRMFAAEIGEGTPQEKVKISRVQQRIDLNGR